MEITDSRRARIVEIGGNGAERSGAENDIFRNRGGISKGAGFAIGIGRPLPIAIFIYPLSIVVASATDVRFELETTRKRIFQSFQNIYLSLVSRSIFITLLRV